MDEIDGKKTAQDVSFPILNTVSCCSGSSCCDTGTTETKEEQMTKKVLNVDLLVIVWKPVRGACQPEISLKGQYVFLPRLAKRWASS